MEDRASCRSRTMEEVHGLSSTRLSEDVPSIPRRTLSLSHPMFRRHLEPFWHGHGRTTLATGNSSRSLILMYSEFYMNCAPVTVVGKGSTSFTGPRMYEANIFGGTQCITPGEVDVVYPNPGGSIQFGGKFVGGNTPGVTDISPCSFDNNVNVTVTGSGTTTDSSAPAPAPAPASAGNSTSSALAPAVTVNAAAADPAPVVSGTSTSTVVVTTTGSVTVTVLPTPGVVTNTVTDDGVDTPAATGAATSAPASNGTTSATADDGTAGAACSPDGTITCGAGGTTFYMCDHGALVSMGSVAAGTTCSNGQITRKRALPPHIFRRHHRLL